MAEHRMRTNPQAHRDLWRAGCVDEAHVRFGRRLGETDPWKHRHRAPSRPHYSGGPVTIGAALGLTVQVVSKLAGQIGFKVLPRRWVVERSFSWINRCRRTIRDYERLPEHHAAMVQWAMVIIMTRRLARHRTTGRLPPTPTG
jgi:Transposase DDE domain